MMKMLRDLNEHKAEAERQKMIERVKSHKLQKANEDDAKLKRQKEVRKRIHRAISKMKGERKTHNKKL